MEEGEGRGGEEGGGQTLPDVCQRKLGNHPLIPREEGGGEGDAWWKMQVQKLSKKV